MSVRKTITGFAIAAAIGVVGAAAPAAAFAADDGDLAISASWVTVGSSGAMIYRFPDYHRGADGHVLPSGYRQYVDCTLESGGYHWYKTTGTNPTYLLVDAAHPDDALKIGQCR